MGSLKCHFDIATFRALHSSCLVTLSRALSFHTHYSNIFNSLKIVHSKSHQLYLENVINVLFTVITIYIVSSPFTIDKQYQIEMLETNQFKSALITTSANRSTNLVKM